MEEDSQQCLLQRLVQQEGSKVGVDNETGLNLKLLSGQIMWGSTAL